MLWQIRIETVTFLVWEKCIAVTDKDRNSYILGLREMYCKSSTTVLATFKSILNDIDDNTSVSNDGLKLLANIKNTMLDRAATEKKFNDILENYRTDYRQKVWENKVTIPAHKQNFFNAFVRFSWCFEGKSGICLVVYNLHLFNMILYYHRNVRMDRKLMFYDAVLTSIFISFVYSTLKD